ncbi:MAG: hypothetical protein LBG76_00735 [Treponema sp.]|jgi:biotin operon repressor|nr:hypothetical protein [Treponema sp.]
MQDEMSLDSYFEKYQQGNLEKKDLEGRIFTYILDNYQRFDLRGWDRDECIDYLCWLYPRLSRTIDRYSYTGASFDAYVRSMIHWSSREYLAIEREHQVIENSYWDLQSTELEVHNPEPEYLETRPFKPVSNPKQTLILLLKSYRYVSDNFISRAAPALGMSKETLNRLIDSLRQSQVDRNVEIQKLRERIFTQYYRRMTLERRISTTLPGSTRYIKLKQLWEKSKLRLAALRKRLRKIRPDASNRLVAEVLGIPKGTVDSNLFAVKSRWKNWGEDPITVSVSKN